MIMLASCIAYLAACHGWVFGPQRGSAEVIDLAEYRAQRRRSAA